MTETGGDNETLELQTVETSNTEQPLKNNSSNSQSSDIEANTNAISKSSDNLVTKTGSSENNIVKKKSSQTRIIESIKGEKPYKIHIFLDQNPILGFSVFCCLFILIFIILLILGQTTDIIKINTRDVPLHMFGHKTKINFDTLTAGYNDATWEKLSISYQQQSVDAGVALRIVYTAKNKKTLLNEKVLRKIEEVENDLLSVSSYINKCLLLYNSSSDVIGCKRHSSISHFYDPDYFKGALDQNYDLTPTLDNFINYLVPSKISNSYETITANYSYLDKITEYWAEYGKGTLNGSGTYGVSIYNSEMMPSTFYYAQPVEGTLENTSLANVFDFLVDKDFGVAPTDTDAKALLSLFYFGIPLAGFDNPNDNKQVVKQEDEIDEWVFKNWHNKLVKWRRRNSNLFDMTWKINRVEWVYMNDILFRDMLLIFGTIITIWLYMVFAMGSCCLGNMGMLMIFMNFGPSILLYRFITTFEYFGILNMLCLFIILSIGADDVFVLVDTWTQTKLRAPNVDRAKRLTYALKHAGKVMATTSLSTIVSFIGNSTSAFPAIYTFGAFAAWLVFVNYCAVIFFYPAVLVLHDEYFYTKDLKYGFCVTKYCFNNKVLCNCCWNEGSKCYNVKSDLDKKQELKKRTIDKFFEDKYYKQIRKYNKLILVLFLLIFLVFFYFASQLEADPNPPQFLPDNDPYNKYNDDISKNFAAEDSTRMNNLFVFGLKGISRKGSDETLIDDIGNVKYTTDQLSYFSENEQLWLQQFCDDLLCEYNDYDCRYQDKMDDLKVADPTNDYEINIRKCFMTEYRTWLLHDPDAAPNATVTAQLHDKFNLTDCFDLNELLNCQWKQWPQPNFNCTIFSMIYIWIEDTLPTTNPDFTASTKNYDYWKPYFYLRKTEKYENLSSQCLTSGKVVTAFFMVTLKLDFFATQDFQDGIKIWEKWDEYIDAWKNNENGDVSTDRYGVQFVEMPEQYRDLFFTDDIAIPSGAYHYFYVQNQIIRESFRGIGISLLLALCILVLATGNWMIALMATFVIFMIVTCVIGFAVMLGWKLGMIESVIFIMVVGMAVDYVVHLSEAYLTVNAKSRGLRAKKMLGRIGSSILSGFLSTLLGIIWLVGSYIISFYKFGLEIAFLEICSVSFGLIGFTAAVSAFGPEGDFGNVKKDSHYIKDCCYNVCCRTRNTVWDEEEDEDEIDEEE